MGQNNTLFSKIADDLENDVDLGGEIRSETPKLTPAQQDSAIQLFRELAGEADAGQRLALYRQLAVFYEGYFQWEEGDDPGTWVQK